MAWSLDSGCVNDHDSGRGWRAGLQPNGQLDDKRSMSLPRTMGEKIKNILIGVGSVLNVMPSPMQKLRVEDHFTPREINDWREVGDDLTEAMRSIDEEVEDHVKA